MSRSSASRPLGAASPAAPPSRRPRPLRYENHSIFSVLIPSRPAGRKDRRPLWPRPCSRSQAKAQTEGKYGVASGGLQSKGTPAVDVAFRPDQTHGGRGAGTRDRDRTCRCRPTTRVGQSIAGGRLPRHAADRNIKNDPQIRDIFVSPNADERRCRIGRASEARRAGLPRSPPMPGPSAPRR